MEPFVDPGKKIETKETYTGLSTSKLTCITCISKWLLRNQNIVFRSVLTSLVFVIFVLIAIRNGQDGLSREVSFRLTSLENTVGYITQKFLEETHRADKLFQQLTSLENTVGYITQKFFEETHRADKLFQQLTSIENTVGYITQKFLEETHRADKLFQQLTSLENTVGDITQMFLEEKHRADKLFQQLEKSRVKRRHNCHKAHDQTQTNVATSVAFSAYLARDLDNLGPDQTVIFENVTLNDGNAYNPLLGTFHVPRAGMYFFTVTLQSFQKRRQWFTLVADRQMQTELLFYPFGHQMATNTAVLRLNEGQIVRVAASEKGVSLQNGYTSKFSGFLMNEC